MNKKTIGAIAILLSLFTACDMPDSERSLDGKAAVRVVINGAQSRTVTPTGALQDVTEWQLFGAKQAYTGEEIQLARFSSAQSSTALIETGVWRFTLTGYKEDAAVLTGTLSDQTISTTETNVLNFTVAPLTEGQGTISLVIELPDGSGITEARVFAEGELHVTLTPSGGKVVFEETRDAGDYYFNIRLYKGDALYGAVSEVVYVWANLQSAATYTLTLADLNAAYAITYHLWDGEATSDNYKATDAAITLAAAPARTDYVFRGWYAAADFSGDAVTAIPAGSTGDRDFYAKWVTPISAAPLQAALTWINANALDGEDYTVTLENDETLAPWTLSYGGKNVSITLDGGDAERTVSLSTTGSLFTIGSGVTLTLDENVTLQGLISNTAALVRVNGGALTMENGSKLSGNTAYNATGGGVYVNSGTFTMNGGTISGNTSSSSTSSYNATGGGVFVNSGTFTMNGGTISDNTSSSAYSAYGGGVYVGSSGTFTMSGGTVSANTSSSSSSSSYDAAGGGVFVNSGTFTMSGGTVSGNTSSSSNYYGYGGGVYVGSSGTFTMSGGTISGNTSSSSYATYSYSAYGGGVCVGSSGTFTKQAGGIIYGSEAGSSLKNTAYSDAYGHAVYVNGSGKRNSTAGTGVTLNSGTSGSAGGWE
jgi:uncharacterized repeat protein (TIGR02543 family)